MDQRLAAEDIVGLLRTAGLPVTAAWVMSRVPGGKRPSPRKPPSWAAGDVARWMRKHGLDRPRTLVKMDELARRVGKSYWVARRLYEPVLVFSRNEKFYEVPR